MTDEEHALLQAFADDLHNQFINDVAEGRSMDVEEVRKIADGRIFSGKTAKELGLIDQLGNLEDAIEMAGRLSGIKGKIVPVYPPQERNLSMIELLTGMSTGDLIHQVAAERTFYGGYLYQP